MNEKSFNEQTAEEFKRETYTDANGVIRWKSNDRVPFDDFLATAGVSKAVRQRCRAAADKELGDFLEAYRRNNRLRQPSAEEQYEMRAAFGPGAEVVNIITGQRYTT